jgi:hypothetical protein
MKRLANEPENIGRKYLTCRFDKAIVDSTLSGHFSFIFFPTIFSQFLVLFEP